MEDLRNGSGSSLDVRLLGSPVVLVDGEPMKVDTRKAVALLSYLIVENRVLGRQVAAGLLWPELNEQSARAALRRTLSVLRKAIGATMTADRETIELELEQRSVVDVARFNQLTAVEALHGHGANAVCPDCASRLEEAVALFRGDFMEGFTLRDSPSFEMWQLHQAEDLRRRLDEALGRLATAYAMSEDFWRAITHARRRVEINPMHEVAWCQLMRLYAWNGDRNAALRAYRECVGVLDSELRVAPLDTTTELMEAIADNDLQPPPRAQPLQSATSDGEDETESVSSQVLEAAAVVSEPFTVDVLMAVAGRSGPETAASVDALVAGKVLNEPVNGEFAFRESIKRKDVAASTTLSRRRILHGRAAEYLTTRQGSPRPSEIARHLELAGQRAEAAKYRFVAAVASMSEHRPPEALAHLDAALALGHESPEIVHEMIGDVEALRGQYGDALTAYMRAASEQTSPAIEAKIGTVFARVGRWQLAEHHMELALADDSLVDRGRVLVDLGIVFVRADRLDDGERCAAEARKTGSDDLSVLARVENLFGIIALRRRKAEAAMRHFDLASQLAERLADLQLRSSVANNSGLALAMRNDLDGAIAAARRAVATTAEIGDRHGEAAARNNLADHLRLAGQASQANDEVVRGLAIMAEIEVEPDKLEPEIWKLTEW